VLLKRIRVEQEWMIAAIEIVVLSPLFRHFEVKPPVRTRERGAA
jgi:hypothetical protein